MRYAVEYNQTDPDDSPTPGLGHFAGCDRFDSLRKAKKAGKRAIGHLTPEAAFSPCCDWQVRGIVTGIRIAQEDENGNETGREWLL